MLLYLNIRHFYIELVVFYFTDHNNDNSLQLKKKKNFNIIVVYYQLKYYLLEFLVLFLYVTDSIKATFNINI